MARGIRIPFVAEVREFIRGTDDVERALDDVSDSLDDLSRDGKDTGRDLERNLEGGADALDDLGDEAKDAGRDLERTFRDIRKDAEKAEDALEDVGDGAKKGFDKVEREAETAGQVVADESRQSAAELGSSFDGSFESIVDGFRDVASSAGVELGGLGGVIVGFGAAAGIGLVTKIVEGMNEKRQQLFESAQSLFDGLTEYAEDSGVSAGKALTEGILDAATRLGRLQEALGTDTLVEALVESNRLAGDLGLASGDVIDILTGGTKETNEGMETVEATLDRMVEKGKVERGAAATAAENAVTAANKLRDLTGQKRQEEKLTTEALRVQRDYQADIARDSLRAADGWERLQAAVSRISTADFRATQDFMDEARRYSSGRP